MSKLYLTFYGGADGATGANFMLEKRPSDDGSENRAGVKILIDCGMIQGSNSRKTLIAPSSNTTRLPLIIFW